ncbi:Uncharacterized protein TCM_000833 [Theobroma cacao]|uniref:Uncharacterized protein n=1 Tax=Theobroma cacao TaxID=3641 RepID=A0A061DH41_THECC|nr:Uncharacterized protein TCM_000833 [Theobroma cacao]
MISSVLCFRFDVSHRQKPSAAMHVRLSHLWSKRGGLVGQTKESDYEQSLRNLSWILTVKDQSVTVLLEPQRIWIDCYKLRLTYDDIFPILK